MTEWLYEDELRLAELNVPRASLQFARALAYPGLDVAGYMAVLHDLSETAAEHVDLSQPVAEQAQQLAGYLFGEVGFRGDPSAYADPRNSYLNEVLDRRVGLPIALSVIYVDVAQRLGIPAYGIGLPGHFIVGIHGRDGEVCLDPFHGPVHSTWPTARRSSAWLSATMALWRPVGSRRCLRATSWPGCSTTCAPVTSRPRRGTTPRLSFACCARLSPKPPNTCATSVWSIINNAA